MVQSSQDCSPTETESHDVPGSLAGGDFNSPGIPKPSVAPLQSEQNLLLLDSIVNLRAYGVGNYISLPQLVVCGDQSSGKSSVLEAITQLGFPRKEILCTMFPTAITLRRTPAVSCRAKIIPDKDRAEGSQDVLSQFEHDVQDISNLEPVIEEALNAMKGGPGKIPNPHVSTFMKDTLSIEFSSPENPQLTVVDLPGLIHTSKNPFDVSTVDRMVDGYMEDPRTIILAIISANNDSANQIVLNKIRKFDPEGKRTVGIITKPDLLPAGSELEAEFLSLARNETIPLQLGWHVLKNRSYDEMKRGFTQDQRDASEKDFFETSSWRGIPVQNRGIHTLRKRLSELLMAHTRRELPKVRKELRAKMDHAEAELRKLGDKRETYEAQRDHLVDLVNKFTKNCQLGTEGTNYEAEIFRDNSNLRLRAAVRNQNDDFAQFMRRQGHMYEFWATEDSKNPNKEEPILTNLFKAPRKLDEDGAIKFVKDFAVQNRGTELPGLLKPTVVGEMFRVQSKQWKAIAEHHIDTTFERCSQFLRSLLSDIAQPNIAEALAEHWILRKMEERHMGAKKELYHILEDSLGNATTNSENFTEHLKRLRSERIAAIAGEALSKARADRGGHSESEDDQESGGEYRHDEEYVINFMIQKLVGDHETHSCRDALDYLTAYYEVARELFIDNVNIQVIERWLLKDLWHIIRVVDVYEMDPELLLEISGETEEEAWKRSSLESQLAALGQGLSICSLSMKGMGLDVPFNPSFTTEAAATPTHTATGVNGGNGAFGTPPQGYHNSGPAYNHGPRPNNFGTGYQSIGKQGSFAFNGQVTAGDFSPRPHSQGRQMPGCGGNLTIGRSGMRTRF